MLFEEFVAARGAALLRFAYVLTLDAHAAEDLVQSALTDAYRHWRRVSAAGNVDAYVQRIVVNTHLGWRRRRSAGERPTGDDLDSVVVDHADAVVDRDASRRLLDVLPPRARTVLVLRYYADLDDAAIADLMGLSVSGVRATASRALGSLRRSQVGSPQPGAIEEVR